MKRMLLCGLALTVCWLGAGNIEAAAIKAGVDTDWASPLVQLSDSSDVPLTVAHRGYRNRSGCYYGPPRHYRSNYWGGYGYGRVHARRSHGYYGHPHGGYRYGGVGLYIGY